MANGAADVYRGVKSSLHSRPKQIEKIWCEHSLFILSKWCRAKSLESNWRDYYVPPRCDVTRDVWICSIATNIISKEEMVSRVQGVEDKTSGILEAIGKCGALTGTRKKQSRREQTEGDKASRMAPPLISSNYQHGKGWRLNYGWKPIEMWTNRRCCRLESFFAYQSEAWIRK